MGVNISLPRQSFNWMEDLRINAPEVYESYLKTLHDTPANYRDGHEAKKKPYRPDDPFRKH